MVQPREFCGSKIENCSITTSATMWSGQRFASAFDGEFNIGADFVGLMNGDSNHQDAHVDCATNVSERGAIALFDRNVSRLTRVDCEAILS